MCSIVGGGITGLTAAYLLTAAGKSVAVLERERCAQIDTGHTSAHLTMVTDRRLTELASDFGRDHAQAVWDAGLAAIVQIDAIVARRADRLRLRVGAGLSARRDRRPTASQAKIVRGGSARSPKARLRCRVHDERAVRRRARVSSSPTRRASIRASISPAWRATITDRGGLIFEHSAAEEFCDEPLSVKAERPHDHLRAHRDRDAHAAGRQHEHRRARRCSRPSSRSTPATSWAGRVEKGRIPDALFWDTADPYHYLRIEPHRDHDVVIFGGEDHKTGQARGHDRVLRSARAHAAIGDRRYRPHASLVGTGDRDAGRPAVHRRDRRRASSPAPASPATG